MKRSGPSFLGNNPDYREILARLLREKALDMR